MDNKFDNTISYADVLSRIAQADHQEVEELIHAIRQRFSQLHPGWELLLYTLQTGNETERNRQVKSLIDFLTVHYLKDI